MLDSLYQNAPFIPREQYDLINEHANLNKDIIYEICDTMNSKEKLSKEQIAKFGASKSAGSWEALVELLRSRIKKIGE